MGNSSSSPQQGESRLGITISPPASSSTTGGHHVAGTRVAGLVYAESDLSLPPQTNLMVYFNGQEDVKVRYTERKTVSKYGKLTAVNVTKYRFAKRDLVHMDIPLRMSSPGERGINPGKYEYPFQFDLPVDLPGTMRFTGNGGYCRIIYKIMVEVTGRGKTEYEFPVLAAPLPIGSIPFLIRPHTEVVNNCICFQVGTVTSGANVENTRIGRGQDTVIDFACKNDTHKEIEHVEAQLEEVAIWQVKGKRNMSNRVLVKTFFRKTKRMEQKTKEDVKQARQKRLGTTPATESARDQLDDLYEEIYEAIMSGENRGTLRVPVDAQNTYRGQCCSVKHLLSIKIKTQGNVDNPAMKVPVHIGTPSSLAAIVGTASATTDPSTTATALPTGTGAEYILPPAGVDATTNSSDLPLALAEIAPANPPADWDSDRAIKATPVCVTADVLVGGLAKESEEEIGDVTAYAVPINSSIEPTLKRLFREMEISVNPVSAVKSRTKEASWKDKLFENLTPNEFAEIVTMVPLEFDQPELGATLAQVKGDKFTCDYVVEVIKVIPSWVRMPMVRELLPYCVDLQTKMQMITDELDAWERVCTYDDFTNELNKRLKK